MNKQDLNGTRTAQDIERKYNLSGMQKNIEYNTQSIFQTNNELNNFIGETTENIENLQEQIDGQIMTWFYDGVPTLNNPPANEWTTDATKNKHLGDLYYDNLTGKAYRFAKQGSIFLWLEITDSDVTEALRIARAAKDTADGKRRVFTTTPNPPYDVGDLWSQGEDGDIKICVTAKTEGQIYSASDWEKASKYTDDSGLNNFINNTYSSTIQSLTNQIDGKAETWYQSTDPSLIWTTEEKARHIGDLWHNSSTNKSYIYDENKTWKEIDGVPDEVYDKIDGKAQVFSAQPTVPYYKKDLWVQGSNGDIYVCNNTRKTGNFNASDWIKASKYTDDTGLNNFIDVTFAESIQSLTNQIDGKVETWYYSGVPTLNNLPASSWSEEQRLKHIKDLYYDKETGYTYIFQNDGQFKWTRIEDEDTIEALALANSAKDTADGKRRVFVSEPIPPYDNGDLWVQGEDGDIYVCQISRQEGVYQDGDFIIASKYTDDTVANAIVTELGGTETTVLHGSVLVIKEAVDHYGIAINDHTEAIGELDEEVGNIVDTTGTAEGKYIHLEDSAEQPLISLELDGETTQETRSGKNIYNANSSNKSSGAINSPTISANGDTIVLTHNSTNATAKFTIPVTLEPNTDYVISGSAIFTDNSGSGASVIYLRTGSGSGTVLSSSQISLDKTITTEQTFSKTFNSGEYTNVYLWLYLDSNVETNTRSCTYKNIMLRKANTTADWEPYGVMPSPDYPSEIKNIEGRNLFYEDQLLEATGWTKNSEGYYTGASRGNLYNKFKYNVGGFKFDKPFKEKTQYTISYEAYCELGTGNPRFVVYYTDGTYENTPSWDFTTPTKLSFTTDATKTVEVISFNYGSGGAPDYIKNIQVNEEIQTDYVPYDNIAVKVEGKNLFDKGNLKRIYTSGIDTYTSNNTGVDLKLLSGSTSGFAIFDLGPIKKYLGKTMTLALDNSSNHYSLSAFVICKPDGSNRNALQTIGNNNFVSSTIQGDFTDERLAIRLYVSNDTVAGQTYSINDIHVLEGIYTVQTLPTYEPYKSQTAFFPLEGQKLMEGSYLADDGIHHVRKQVVFDGSSDESWSMSASSSSRNAYAVSIEDIIDYTDSSKTPNLISDRFIPISYNGTWKIGNIARWTNRRNINLIVSPELDLAAFKTWLSTHPTTVEYELAEEEIISYTTDQQEAYNNLQGIRLFQGKNNITSDATAEIHYYNYLAKDENIYVTDKREQLIAVFNKDDENTLINPRIVKAQNSETIFTFSIDARNPKWEQIKNPENLYWIEDKVYSTNFDTCFTETISEDDEKTITVTAYERQKLLSRKFVKAWNSETDLEIIDTFMVVVLSNGNLPLKNNGNLVNSSHQKGTSGYVLDALLYGTGWTTGICDVQGTFDLESDEVDIYENILKVQEIWGGILVFDSVNKIIHHRDETVFLPYNGYEVKYKKNMQSLEKIQNNKIITKLCPLGESGLNIKTVNEGSEWIEDYTYTDTVLEGIESNPDITDPEQLLRWGRRKLQDLCKPSIELTVDTVLLYQLEGYELESVDLNDIVDVINYNEIDGDIEQLRVIRFEYSLWDKTDSVLELGNITLDSTDIFKKSVRATNTINEGTLNSAKVVTYLNGKKSLNTKLRNVDRTITNINTELYTEETGIVAKVTKTEDDVDDLNNEIISQATTIAGIQVDVGNVTTRVATTETNIGTLQGDIVNLQSQIDGAIQFWNGASIPTLNNYPANEWTTEAMRNNHRADIYSVIEDVQGELKQGKSYRFDKVGDIWKWIELTDNELSAVQALANSKAKVFVVQPTPPYNIGDFWLKNGKLYRCKTAKGSSGSYSLSDWEEAVEYTDDTVANLANALADTANTNANTANNRINTIVDTTGTAEGKNIHLEDSAEQPLIALELDGETSQATRSGKNLFNYPSITNISSNIPNGTLVQSYSNGAKVQGNASSNPGTESWSNGWFTPGSTQSDAKVSVEAGTDIYISADITLLNQYNSDSNKTKIYIYGTNSIAAGSLYQLSLNQKTRISRKFTITETGTYYPVFTLHSNILLIENIMISTSEDTTYEPYGVMPSPDYPSEIKNVSGRNLFDLNNKKDNTILSWAGGVEVAENKGIVGDYEDITNLHRLYSNYKFYIFFYDNNKTYLGNSETLTTGNGIEYSSNPINIDNVKILNPNVKYCRVEYRSRTNSNQDMTTKTDILLCRTLEEIQTDYVPYDSIAVKVEGKNLVSLNTNKTKTIGGVPFAIENGIINIDGETTSNSNFYFDSFKTNSENAVFSIEATGYTDKDSGNAAVILQESIDNTTWTTAKELSLKSNTSKQGGVTLDSSKYYRIRLYVNSNTFTNATIKIQLEYGLVKTNFEPYKSQTAFFPLHGQKLMEGSYLADDGIHHVRKQVVFNGIEDWSIGGSGNTGTINRFNLQMTNIKALNLEKSNLLSNYFIAENGYGQNIESIYVNASMVLAIYKDETVLNNFKTWLSTHPTTVEYELAEEEIIPYTTDQQEAWYNLLSLNTYKNVSNITSDAYAKIEYAKDNGLDIYETKDNAKRTYKVTEDKISQLIIDKNFIKTEVSDTKSALENNYYTKNDADNTINGAIDGAKSELNNIISQNKTEIEQTATQIAMRVSSIETNGVDKVTTSIGYTFDDEGLKINKTGAKTNSKLDEKGFSVKDSSSQDLFYAGYKEDGEYAGQTVVETSNLVVNNYLNVNGAGRFQPYVNPVLGGHGIGCFDIGGVQ